MIGLLLLPALSGWLPTWRLPVLPASKNQSLSRELRRPTSEILVESMSPALTDDAAFPAEAREQVAETPMPTTSANDSIFQASEVITTDSAPWPWLDRYRNFLANPPIEGLLVLKTIRSFEFVA